jgi:hypothetical protein
MELGSHMVPILNNIGTDVACVGVSHLLFPSTPQFVFCATVVLTYIFAPPEP